MITNRSGDHIADFVLNSYHLEVLKLSHNQLQTSVGIKIAENLKNSNVMILDLSWNSLGAKRDGNFGKAFRLALANEKLKHADLSYNSLIEKDMAYIAEALKNNHTLWGFHVIGN